MTDTLRDDGVEIQGRFYPWAESFDDRDIFLARRVAGLSRKDFLRGVQQGAQDDAKTQARITLGLAAVAFWHGNPAWSSDRVERHIRRITGSPNR